MIRQGPLVSRVTVACGGGSAPDALELRGHRVCRLQKRALDGAPTEAGYFGGHGLSTIVFGASNPSFRQSAGNTA
jgi:hypothetical protein